MPCTAAGHASFIHLAGHRLIIVTKIIITQGMALTLLVMTVTGPAQAELEYNLVFMMAGLGFNSAQRKKVTQCK